MTPEDKILKAYLKVVPKSDQGTLPVNNYKTMQPTLQTSDFSVI